MVSTLLRRRLWWAGHRRRAVTGYAFQAVALAFGSLLLVAPLLVSALLFALPLSARLAHRRVTRAEWGWAMLLTVALGVFVALARTQPGDYEGVGTDRPWRGGRHRLVFVAGCLLVALRLSDWRRAITAGGRRRRAVRRGGGAHQDRDAHRHRGQHAAVARLSGALRC